MPSSQTPTDLTWKSTKLAYRQWIEIRRRVSLMGRGKEVGAGRQPAQIQSNREVGVHPLGNSYRTSRRFACFTASIGGDRDNVVATRTEIRKDHVGGHQTTWKDPDWGS